MKTAFDTSSSENMTVERYHHMYGAKLVDQKLNPRPRVICPACEETMSTRGEGVLVDATWVHTPSDTFCPIKNSADSRYEILAPKAPNLAIAADLRRSFFDNWALHWSYARSKAAFADILDFIAFVTYADKKGLWGYSTILEWQLPYIFLVTCEFPPPKGKAASFRRDWLRFRFDARVRTLEDLWIRVLPGVRLLRLRYRKPRSGVPGVTHYLDSHSWDLDSDWMRTHTVVPPHEFALSRMHDAFPSELGPLPT